MSSRLVSKSISASPDGRQLLVLASYRVDTLATAYPSEDTAFPDLSDGSIRALPPPGLFALLINTEMRAIVMERRLSTIPDMNASAAYVQKGTTEAFVFRASPGISPAPPPHLTDSRHLLRLDLATHALDTLRTSESIVYAAGTYRADPDSSSDALFLESSFDGRTREAVLVGTDGTDRWRLPLPFLPRVLSLASDTLYVLDSEDNPPMSHESIYQVATTLRRYHISGFGLREATSTPLRLHFPAFVHSLRVPTPNE